MKKLLLSLLTLITFFGVSQVAAKDISIDVSQLATGTHTFADGTGDDAVANAISVTTSNAATGDGHIRLYASSTISFTQM